MPCSPHLLHVEQQRLAVVLPLGWQLGDVGEFVTRQLHRDLEAVGVQIAEVIYACQWGVKKQSGVSLSMESEKIKWGKIQENEIKWKQCSLKHISSVYIYISL